MSHKILDAKQEFQSFFILLQQNVWFNKISSTRELDKVISSYGAPSRPFWDYTVLKLEFKNICLERHVRPSIVSEKLKSGKGISKVILSMSCACDSKIPTNDMFDPINSLTIKLITQFEYMDEEIDDFKTLYSSWHFDKHNPALKISSLHPLYHYEYGGSEVTKADDFNYGDFILLDTPRIMHPPLDIVLSIDFIIKHYYKVSEHVSLTQNPSYVRYINNAKYRIWRPYFLSLASHYHDFGKEYILYGDFARNIIECPYNTDLANV